MATMADRCIALHKRPPLLPSHPQDLSPKLARDLSPKLARDLANDDGLARHHSLPSLHDSAPNSGRSSGRQSGRRRPPVNDTSCSRPTSGSRSRSQSSSQRVVTDNDSRAEPTPRRRGSKCSVSRKASLASKFAMDENGSHWRQSRRMAYALVEGKHDPESNRSRIRELSKGSASSRNISCSSNDAPDLNDMYGFQVGDCVTTDGGPDAVGPWQNMGHGVVCGVGCKAGMLDVRFANGERFAIRAKNLKKASEEKTASGTDQQNLRQQNLCGFEIGEVVEFLNESELGGWVHLGGGRGVVVEAGNTPGTIFVKLNGCIGARAIRADRLGRVRTDRPKDQPGKSIGSVIAGNSRPTIAGRDEKKSTVNLRKSQAREEANEEVVSADTLRKSQAREEAKEEASVQLPVVSSYDSELDGFVRAKTDPWRELGIGIVRRLGDKEDTVWVQFDVGADQWLLSCKDLESVPDPGLSKFAKYKRKDFDV